jgi:nucleoside-diphosphate-sugar epimerase
MNWKDKRVLITGGAGFIGSNLLGRLLGQGADVRVADNLWRGKPSNLIFPDGPAFDPERQFLAVDLADYQNCRKAVADREIVFHLADIVAGIDYVFGHEMFIFRQNLLVNTQMLHAAIEQGGCRYVYVGTACSYPKEKQNTVNPPPLKEEDAYPANPESSYGWSKLMGEYECGLAQRESGIDIGILRLHNTYGPRCDFSPERSQVIPSLTRKAIRYPAEPFIVWGSGNQRRAFVYVDDVVDALLSVVERGMNRGPIQIGPGASASIREIAETIASLSGKGMEIRYDTSRQEGDTDRYADWSKAGEILGWSPKVSLETGLRRTYDWLKSQLEA